MDQALAGLRVLDLTRLFPGGYLTSVLRQMGAEVIKVEPPWGDGTRGEQPQADGRSYYHLAMNRGKRSLALDLRQEPGVEILRRLCEGADVLVENFRPGVTGRLGIAAQDMMEANPSLIYVSLTGFGDGRPLSEVVGHDVNYLAATGMLDALGMPGAPGVFLSDVAGAMWGVIGILGALVDRVRGQGEGRRIEIAFTDAVRHWAALQSAMLAVAGRSRLPMFDWPCYHVYATRDGRQLAVGAIEPKFWEAFCDALGRPDWRGRGQDPALVAEVQAQVATRSQAEWVTLLDGCACCVNAVRSFAEASADPALAQDPARGDWPPLSPPSADVPDLGEDSGRILREMGYPQAAVSRLFAQGVVLGKG